MSHNPPPQTYRQLSHAAANASGRERVIVEVLERSGPLTRNQIEAATNLSIQSVCGGVGKLLDMGAVFTTEATGGQIVTLDPDPGCWDDRAALRTQHKQLDRIKEFVADHATRLDASTTEGLRRLYASVRSKAL